MVGRARGQNGHVHARARVLTALAGGASITAACALADVGRSTFYQWRASDAEFNEAVNEAIEAGTDRLEDEAFRRAHDGSKRPIYQGGKRVGIELVYSDTLLMLLLKARRPNKFRERTTPEIAGTKGLTVVPAVNISLSQPIAKSNS